MRRLSGGDAAAAISHADSAYASDLVASANCVEDISDVVEWLQARYGREMRQWAGATARKPAPPDGALERLVARIGISARQVGENIGAPGRHAVADSPGDAAPLDAAKEAMAADDTTQPLRFASPEAALRAGVAAFAAQLAVDPHVRRHVRAYCEAHACVVVRATDRGLREIADAEHPAFAFKFLRQKPVAEFAGSAQFLGVAHAADAGLLRVAFSLTGEYRFGAGVADDAAFAADAERSALVVARQLDAHVRSYAAHDGAGAWNAVRADAVLQAARAVLALVWRETAQRLRAQAAEHVADACRRALQARIDAQPPRPHARVVVVAGGGFDASSRGALRVVYVDEHGRAREDFSADSLRRGDAGPAGDGVAALAALLQRRAVDVVAVAGMALQARRVFDDVRALVDDHCARHGADVLVTYADDAAARLWWDCDAARAELPAMRREERYCVAVARTLQDAPNAYAALGADVLKLRLHPAQRLVDAALLLPAVQRAFVNVVAKSGVDVNAAAAHPHRAHVLPFVAGLGPRKAHAILARTSPAAPLESRNDLVTRRLCTRCVFVNCASFLRIRPPLADALDATRIHPQDYILAYKMALDALDIEEDDDDATATGRRGARQRSGPARYVAEVAEGLFQHIDVQERDKPNDAALGSTFLVGDSAYTDLDELVAFHVDPIARKLEEVKRNPKFYDPETDPLYSAQPMATVLGVNDYSDEYRSRRQDLWESRTARHLDTLAQSTGRGSYCISLSLLKPGSLVLAFKPTPTYAGIMKWTARVEPNEFKLGEKGRYPDINGLINGFKRMQTSSTSSSSSHKPASGAYEESRSSTSGRSHHQHRSYGDTGSSSRWGESRDNRSSRSTNAWGEQQPSSSSQRQSGAAAASSSSRWDS
ncbi:Transcription elongation factor spt6 [Coemansia sp. RSA 1836]|nr:Transcription elongation factor spt6 [Coemansia sp. RSA 1836]